MNNGSQQTETRLERGSHGRTKAPRTSWQKRSRDRQGYGEEQEFHLYQSQPYGLAPARREALVPGSQVLEIGRAKLEWDKLQPGKLCYLLDGIKLDHQGVLRNGEAKTVIPKGQCLVIMRNLMLAYPNYVTYEQLLDRIYQLPDREPVYAGHVLRRQVWEINQVIPRCGLYAKIKFKLGYRLEFIKRWQAL